jgi:hypothetical protein
MVNGGRLRRSGWLGVNKCQGKRRQFRNGAFVRVRHIYGRSCKSPLTSI